MVRRATRSSGWLMVVTGAALLALVVARTVSASPSAAGVSIVDFAFNPASTTVKVGDSVTWTNNGQAPHTATADGGAFDTGILNNGQSGTATFSSAGTFKYFCAVHPEMRGTITAGDGPDTLPETGDAAGTAIPIALLAAAGALLLGGGAAVTLRSRAR